MDVTNRQGRFLSFKRFFEESKEIFESLKKGDGKHKELDSHYNLCICPGGWDGGTDSSRIEIFYGQRPVLTVVENDRTKPFGKKERLISESGACLTYQRVPTGMVLCFLQPAALEGIVPSEDFIDLGLIPNADKLMKGKLIERHWRYLNAYMECTCIDGTPSFSDRIYVFWLRNMRPLVVKKEERKPRIISFMSEVIKYSLTVGLSGGLLFLMTFYLLPPSIQKVSLVEESEAVLARELNIENRLNSIHELMSDEVKSMQSLNQTAISIEMKLEEKLKQEKSKK